MAIASCQLSLCPWMTTGSDRAAVSAAWNVWLLKLRVAGGPESDRCWHGCEVRQSKTTRMLHVPAPSLPAPRSGPKKTLRNRRWPSALDFVGQPAGSWMG